MSITRRLRAALCAVTIIAGTAGGLGSAAAAPLVPSAAADTIPPADPVAAVTYQQNPAHDGHSTDASFVAPFTKRWSTTLGGGTIGYPLVVDGRVFVTVARATGYGTDIEALSLATGEVLWGPRPIGGTYGFGAIAYDRGQIFAINFDGLLTATDAVTGSVSWTRQLAGQYAFTSPPTAVNGTVYVGGAGSGGTLYAVDEATGSTRWTAPVANGDHSSPAVDETGVYVSYACEQTWKFGFTGTRLWQHSTYCSGGGGRTPVLHDGKVYVRDSGMSPAVLDAASGAQTAVFVAGPAPAFDGQRMASVAGGTLTVSDTSTGDQIWSSGGGAAVTAPLIVNGYVVEGLRDGTVEARRVEDGQLAWSGQAGAALAAPDEHNAVVLTGLAQGDGTLVVPAGATLTVFEPVQDPTVTLTDGPSPDAFSASATAVFGFTSAVRNAQYRCTLDGRTQPCTSPLRLGDLAQGTHTFSVSVDHASTGWASRTFKVDTVAPAVRTIPFVHQVTRRRTVTAQWSASDGGSGVRAYQARVGRARLGKPVSAWTVRTPTTATWASLSIPRRTRLCVSVRATDRAGNWSSWSAPQCTRRR